MSYRDYNEFSMVKTFIYVNDVSAGGGPSSCAQGTHCGWLRGTDSRFVRDSRNSKRVIDDEMAQFVGAGGTTTITGRTGTVVITDVSGFHKCDHATEADRSTMVLTYISPHCSDRIDAPIVAVCPDAHPAVCVAAGGGSA